MRKFLCLLIGCLLLGQTCYAISIADGELTQKCGFTGSSDGNEHVHVSTIPCKVYSLTVTAVTGGGFAQLIETKDAGVDTSITGIYTASSGDGQLYVSEGIVKADVVVATAANTIQVTFENGLAIGRQLFLDCSDARAIVSYRK